jgi:hypothetical protein
MESSIKLDDLFSVKEFAMRHSRILTEAKLRWQLRHRDRNGLSEACVRIGNELMLNEPRYEKWLTTQAGAGVSKHVRVGRGGSV